MFYRINSDLFRDRFVDGLAAMGDNVLIIDGEFCGFEGRVMEIDDLQSLAVVAIMVFRRVTPVTVNYGDIQKLSDLPELPSN